MAMVVHDFITTDFPVLKPTDTVQYALLMMEDFSVTNLIIVDGSQLIGYAHYAQLDDMNPDMPLSDLVFENKPVSVDGDHSIINALKHFAETHLDLLAVVRNDMFEGTVWSKDLVNALGNSTTAGNDGSVLLLECDIYDYSISLIGRLVEAEDGKVLGLWTWQPEEDQKIQIMLKLNIRHIDNIVSVLRSNGYRVLHHVNNKTSELFEDRYKSLMNYLDI